MAKTPFWHFPTKLKTVYAFGFSVCLSVRLSVCLSVRLAVCPRSNSLKYSSNVLKFIYVIHIWYRMDRIENGIYGAKGSSTQTHKIKFLNFKISWYKCLNFLQHFCNRKYTLETRGCGDKDLLRTNAPLYIWLLKFQRV